MHYTQNNKIAQVQNTTLIVGVDIGSTTQYARAFDWRGIELGKVFKFQDCRSGYELFLRWIKDMQTENKKQDVIVGCEPTGHYWFGLRDFLESQSIKLVLVNPLHVKQTKEMDDNSQTKNDQKDPKVIAKLVKDGRYMEPYIPHDVYAELRNIWGLRLRVTKQLISLKNRFLRWFKIYFPEYLQVFGSFDGKGSLALLKVACLPVDMMELGAEGINKIWRAQKMRAIGLKRAEMLVKAAESSVGSKLGPMAARMELACLMKELELYSEQYELIM